MMRPRDRTLRRWLRTGRPRRVAGYLDDPEVAARLEAMTALDAEAVEALSTVTAPPADLTSRMVDELGRRQGGEAMGAVVDLLSLGWRTASVFVDPSQGVDTPTLDPRPEPDPRSDPRSDPEGEDGTGRSAH